MLTLTAGTALLMWMGELITQRGIGNGMSLLIFASVVSRAARPTFGTVQGRERHRRHDRRRSCMFIVLLVAIVFIEQGQRRIPVQFAKRVVGRRMYGGQSTYIPLKVNQSGVIPIIFASSVLYLPVIVSPGAAGRRRPPGQQLGVDVQQLDQRPPGPLDQPRLPASSTAC